jgi:hypothetical protein
VALVSSSETAPGAGMIFVPNVSTTGANYFAVQGLAEGGATTLTVSAPGYAPLTYTVEVDPSGFVIHDFNLIDTAFDPLTGGSATLSVVQPAGYETISNPANNRRVQLVATVSP